MDILFRGFHKQADGPDTAIIDGVVEKGRWLYGDFSYHVQGGVPHIFPADGYDSADCYEVEPSTVGQWAGLTDKNGKKIFVGDACKDSYGWLYSVGFDTENAAFGINGINGNSLSFRFSQCYPKLLEITGTIYDPPEGASHEPV